MALQTALQAQNRDNVIAAAEDLLTKYADTDFKEIATYYGGRRLPAEGRPGQGRRFTANRCSTINPKNFQATLMVGEILAKHTRENDLDKEEKLTKAEKFLNATMENVKTAPQAQSAAHRCPVGRAARSTSLPRRTTTWGSGRVDPQELRRGHHRFQAPPWIATRSPLIKCGWHRPTSCPARTMKPSPSATSCWPTRSCIRTIKTGRHQREGRRLASQRRQIGPRPMRAELASLEARINYRFSDPELLRRALTHSSLANESRNGARLAAER